MLKLFKNIDGKLHYWETWDKDDRTGVVHWGIAGEKGISEEIGSGFLSSFRKKIQKLINEKAAEGYSQIDERTLIIEYAIDGMGTEEDVEKRYRLQARMDETLGWTGLGHCDGGSIGSGTMEVCCLVVDFETAKRVIENDLEDTEFKNYSRIFEETEE